MLQRITGLLPAQGLIVEGIFLPQPKDTAFSRDPFTMHSLCMAQGETHFSTTHTWSPGISSATMGSPVSTRPSTASAAIPESTPRFAGTLDFFSSTFLEFDGAPSLLAKKARAKSGSRVSNLALPWHYSRKSSTLRAGSVEPELLEARESKLLKLEIQLLVVEGCIDLFLCHGAMLCTFVGSGFLS